jgi:tRNA pseudouridine55 synthase
VSNLSALSLCLNQRKQPSSSLALSYNHERKRPCSVPYAPAEHLRNNEMDGILLLDKAKGLSSAALVALVKKKCNPKKIGHGGTLDPMATGLLPMALDEGTKLLSFLLGGDKEYIAEATLGATTDTDDAEGKTLQTQPYAHLTPAQIEQALLTQRGVIWQKPPVYSALKRDGTPLYKLARQGKEVETEARQVEVKALELLSIEGHLVRFRVACGKGTYIRSMARELGEALGCGAHLSALRRTKVGTFSIEQAKPLEEISTHDLISCAQALSFLPSIQVQEALARQVSDGLKMPASALGFAATIQGPACVLTRQGGLLAVAVLDGNDGLSWQRIFHPNS